MINKNNNKLRAISYLILLLPIYIFSCGNPIDKPLKVEEYQIVDAGINKVILTDSASLITKLYESLTLLPSNEFSDFSYDVNYSSRKKIITIESSNEVAGHKIDYFIVLKDTANLYSKGEFSIHDYSYEILDTYFKIDGEKIDLLEILLQPKFVTFMMA